LEAIVIQAQRGDRVAYELVVRRFQDMAVGYAYAVLGDAHLAADAAQEAFIAAFYELAALRDPRAFPGWFRRILYKQIDRLRRANRVALLPLEEAAHLAAPRRDPAQVAEQRELQRQVRAAIVALPEHQRVVVALFYISAYSIDEIGRFLGIPTATVKTRLHAARRRLKERMLAMIDDGLSGQRPSRDDRFTDRVMTFIFRPMDEASVRSMLDWRYAPPFDCYNIADGRLDEDEVQEVVRFFVDPRNAYYSVVDEQDQLIAFCCFGWDAQVQGGDYTAEALDIGLQVKPDLAGSDFSVRYVEPFVDFARRTFAPTALRTTVATFNAPELRAFEQAGFRPVQTFHNGEQDRTYVVLTQSA
jgi:RNA polymerase sigma factor (sigma-70 family)